MKMYLLQNVFAALRSLMEVAVIILEGKYDGELIDMDNGVKLIRDRGIHFLKNIMNIFIAVYYLSKPEGKASKIGVIGIITSIIGILESLRII